MSAFMINLSFLVAIRYQRYAVTIMEITVSWKKEYHLLFLLSILLSNIWFNSPYTSWIFFILVYVDTGVGQTNPVTLTFVTSGGSFSRSWKVRISQIRCSTIYRAEEGCLQYFTGVSGQIKSFNYDPMTGLQLSNQDYSICIRMERNFCGIQYMACTDDGTKEKSYI